ncbi:MAG TPA: helix-turn-helix domain-containing protein [Acidimicrobiales bacterium]|nr:helix-turn-helix domain-containing protein [Acidimicrobiales bacterium]
MANERLRTALGVSAMTVDELAAKLQVDPKTVERWISTGRTPHARHRRAAALCLGQDEGWIWPDVVPAHRVAEATRAELLSLYPHRSDAPAQLWWSLFEGAQDQIAYVAYAALFLFESHPDLVALLAAKASAGCQVRLALGDATSDAVHQRGEDERFGEGIESRVNLALKHIEPIRQGAGVEVRLHGTTLYNSIYRFDDQLLVNTHLWGVNAYEAPLLHLRRVEGGKLFDLYADNLEQIWSTAIPLTEVTI